MKLKTIITDKQVEANNVKLFASTCSVETEAMVENIL